MATNKVIAVLALGLIFGVGLRSAVGRDKMTPRAPDVGKPDPTREMKAEGYAINVSEMRRALAAKRVMSQYFAIQVIAERHYGALVPELEQRLHPDFAGYEGYPRIGRDMIRVAAANALLMMHKTTDQAKKALTEVVIHTDDIYNLVDAAQALAPYGNSEALSRVSDILLDAKESGFRRTLAARVLSTFKKPGQGHRGPESVLWEAIRQEVRVLDKSGLAEDDRASALRVIRTAVESLAELGDDKTLQRFKDYNTSHPAVRKIMADACDWLAHQLEIEQQPPATGKSPAPPPSRAIPRPTANKATPPTP